MATRNEGAGEDLVALPEALDVLVQRVRAVEQHIAEDHEGTGRAITEARSAFDDLAWFLGIELGDELGRGEVAAPDVRRPP